jgi:hypothetical protein
VYTFFRKKKNLHAPRKRIGVRITGIYHFGLGLGPIKWVSKMKRSVSEVHVWSKKNLQGKRIFETLLRIRIPCSQKALNEYHHAYKIRNIENQAKVSLLTRNVDI